jgi:hypothetical protein
MVGGIYTLVQTARLGIHNHSIALILWPSNPGNTARRWFCNSDCDGARRSVDERDRAAPPALSPYRWRLICSGALNCGGTFGWQALLMADIIPWSRRDEVLQVPPFLVGQITWCAFRSIVNTDSI